MGMCDSVGRAGIDRGARRRDVERYAVRARGQRDAVGADLVRHVAVGGDPVGADDHAGHVAPPKPARRHAVGDHGDRAPRPREFPRREAAALQQWAGLVGDHATRFAPPRAACRSAPARCRCRRWRARPRCSGSARSRPRRSAPRPPPRSGRTSRGPLPRWRSPRRATPPRDPRLPRRRPSARRSMRSSAQRRLTAVGRVAPSAADAAQTPASEAGPRWNAERHAHRGGDADERCAAHAERANGLGDCVHRYRGRGSVRPSGGASDRGCGRHRPASSDWCGDGHRRKIRGRRRRDLRQMVWPLRLEIRDP